MIPVRKVRPKRMGTTPNHKAWPTQTIRNPRVTVARVNSPLSDCHIFRVLIIGPTRGRGGGGKGKEYAFLGRAEHGTQTIDSMITL